MLSDVTKTVIVCASQDAVSSQRLNCNSEFKRMRTKTCWLFDSEGSDSM